MSKRKSLSSNFSIKLKHILVLLSIILLVVIVRQTKVLQYQQSNSTNKDSVITPSTESISEWQEYVDPVGKYSFKYPREWVVIPATGRGSVTEVRSWPANQDMIGSGSIPATEIKIEIYSLDNPNKLSLDEYSVQNTSNVDLSEKTEVVTISGMKGIKQTSAMSSGTGYITTVYFADGDKIYRLLASPADSEYITDFEQLVSSFALPIK